MAGFFQKAKAVAGPRAMPMPDDKNVGEAKKRKAAEVAKRGGRASTILSEDDKLGGKNV